ncbi:MAG: IPTL-CTERM sorting domain-containing protein [Planctomycetes bacterium]|nr:IPTL-CTERM sorting domain-containing protein [Planctomycetota bacterium]
MKLGTKEAFAVGCVGVLALGTVSVVADDATCSMCGPGADWIDFCAAGPDSVGGQGATIGIDFDLDCIAEPSIVLGSCGTGFVVSRGAPSGGTIDTEIVDLCMTGGGLTMVAGAGLGQGGVLPGTFGSIVEQAADNTLGDSTFAVMFEIDLGGGNYVYNHTPLIISSVINCVPPKVTYIHPDGCTPLFDSPNPGQGTLIANLVSANHNTGVPTVSEWGLIVLTVLGLTAGTMMYGRRRQRVAA